MQKNLIKNVGLVLDLNETTFVIATVLQLVAFWVCLMQLK